MAINEGGGGSGSDGGGGGGPDTTWQTLLNLRRYGSSGEVANDVANQNWMNTQGGFLGLSDLLFGGNQGNPALFEPGANNPNNPGGPGGNTPPPTGGISTTGTIGGIGGGNGLGMYKNVIGNGPGQVPPGDRTTPIFLGTDVNNAVSSFLDRFKKPPDPYVAPPDLSFLGQGGGGGGAGTDFYSWLADQRAREGNPQLQRTSIDWTGYGSGQQPMPPQPTPTPYSAYPGAGGGGGAPPDMWSAIQRARQAGTPPATPPAGSSGSLSGYSGVLSGGGPGASNPGGGNVVTPTPLPTGSPPPPPPAAGGGFSPMAKTQQQMIASNTDDYGGGTGTVPKPVAPGAPPPPAPPPPSGGTSPKAVTAAAPPPPPPPGASIAGGPRSLGTGTSAGQMTPTTPLSGAAGPLSQGGPGFGPKYLPTPNGPNIPAVGQFANPVFQQQQQTRNEQTGLLSRLKSDMEGGAPSLAQILMRKGTDENIAAANAIAASGGPQNAAAAQRQAALSASKANQDLVGQSAALRAQEYTQARQEATGLANQLRVNDLMSTGMSYDNAIQQAKLEADQAKTQLGADVQMAGIRGQREQGLLDIGMRGQALNSEQQMHLADLLMQKYGIDKGAATAAASRPGMLDYILKGAATGGAVGGPYGAVAGGVAGYLYGNNQGNP